MKSVRSFHPRRHTVCVGISDCRRSGFAKLDSMESPVHPFCQDYETLLQEWQAWFAAAPPSIYPNLSGSGLQEALRLAFDIPDCADIALGNGSDELIQFITMLTAKPGAAMLAAEPSFVMYRHNAALYGMDWCRRSTERRFHLNLPAVLEAVRKHSPCPDLYRLPQQPHGCMFHACRKSKAVIEASDGIVVVDEVYGAFNGDALPQAGSIPVTSSSCVPSAKSVLPTAYWLCGRLSRSHRRTAKSCRPTI